MEKEKEEKKLTQKEGAESTQPSYDELKNWCNQLLMQRNQVAERLEQVTDVLNKMPWLFKVIENSKEFNSEFVARCAIEIEAIMTPQEPEKEPSKSNTKEN